MTQRTRSAPDSPEEAPRKIQKCGSGDFAKEAQDPEEAPLLEEAPGAEEAPLAPAPTSAQVASDIPDARLIAEVQSLLVGVDLSSMTMGDLRARLEGNLGLTSGTLAARKKLRRRLSFVVHQEVMKKSQRSQQCEKVIKELLKLEDYPRPARQMLVDSLHHSVSATGEEPLHPHQVRLLRIAEDALLSGKARQEVAQATIEEALRCAERDLLVQEASATAASATAAAAKRTAETLQAAAKDTELEIAETQQDLASKQQRAKDVVKETERQQALLQAASGAARSLAQLAEGAWAKEEEWWECFAELQQHLLDTDAESSLMTAATVALKKRPGDRSSFDGIAVEGVENFLRDRLAATEDQIAQQARLEMEAEATTLGVQALLDATKQRARSQQEALHEARAAQDAAESAAASAATALEARRVAVAEKQQDQVDVEARLLTANEALELLGGWIAGRNPPSSDAKVPLPLEELETPVPPEVPRAQEGNRGGTSPEEVDVPAPMETPVKAFPEPGIKDGSNLMADIHSPLRVPTPMKGRT